MESERIIDWEWVSENLGVLILLLDMINSSFINIPQIQDQDTQVFRNPLPVNDAFRFHEGIKDQDDMIKEQQIYRYFPTSAMYNRQSNF
jgi:hypothetical protein